MRIKEVGDLLPDDALMTHAAPAGGLYICTTYALSLNTMLYVGIIHM